MLFKKNTYRTFPRHLSSSFFSDGVLISDFSIEIDSRWLIVAFRGFARVLRIKRRYLYKKKNRYLLPEDYRLFNNASCTPVLLGRSGNVLNHFWPKHKERWVSDSFGSVVKVSCRSELRNEDVTEMSFSCV